MASTRYRPLFRCAIAAAILAAGALYVHGCGQDGPTEPTPEPPGEDYVFVDSTTIGAGGGTLDAGGFALTVPAGAFQSDRNVALYASSKDVRFGDDQVSKTYRLEGIGSWTQPLGISLAYTGALSHTSYVAAGVDAVDPAWGVVAPTYSSLPATASAGRLLCELAAPVSAATGLDRPSPSSADEADVPFDVVYLSGITGQLKATIAGHQPFNVYYPANLFHRGDEIADIIEACWILLHSGNGQVMNIPVCGGPWARNDTAMVMVRASKGDDRPGGIGRPAISPYNPDTYYLWLNADKIAGWSRNEIATETISLYWLLAHSWNDEQFTDGRRIWFHQAFSLAMQSLIATTPQHVPALFPHHEMEPFRGPKLLTSNLGTGWDYGCGMAPLARYVTTIVNKSTMDSMSQEFCSDQKNGWEVLLAHFGKPIDSWFPEFFKMYVGGEIYGVDPSEFLSNLSGTFVIGSAADTLHTFSQPYNDLSAKIFLVSLNYPEIDSNAKIGFTCKTRGGSNRTAVVFGRKPDGLHYLADSWELTLQQTVRSLMDEGYNELVAVVTNHGFTAPEFDGEWNIDLTVRVDTPAPQLPYVFCEMLVFVEAQYSNSVPHTYWATATLPMEGQGTFTGNEFEGAWANIDDGYSIRNGHVRLTLDPGTNTIATFEIADTMLVGGDKTVMEVHAQDVPESDSGPLFLYFSESGLAVETRVTQLSWRSDTSLGWQEIIDYRASELSTLEIILRTYVPTTGRAVGRAGR